MSEHRSDTEPGTLDGIEARGPISNAWRAGRSLVAARHGMIATSHPSATIAGLDELRAGGSAMDAAIAAAAVLAVVEPMMTGLGGDAFFLYREAATGRVFGLNGSGRSPAALSADVATVRAGPDGLEGWDAVTVPGGVDAWDQGWRRFGRRPWADLLAPAIRHAREGFAVAPVVAATWRLFADRLRADPEARKTFLADDRPPALGAVFRNPPLAESLELLAGGGPEAFYRGPIAAEICRYAQADGGWLTVDDFATHRSTWVEPISTDYRGSKVLQLPPNGQGLAVLLMLNLLEGFDLRRLGSASAAATHLMIEAKKLAFADAQRWIADPDHAPAPLTELLSKDYANERRRAIDPERAAALVSPGFGRGSDTVYLTAIDAAGNACSFINSIFEPFGSGIVGGHTGILLQNRGAGFATEPGHPNVVAPGKRPFHTIIPGMVIRDGALQLSYGVMGGSMQPQGHVQLLTAHLDFGLDLQEAVERPRWRHTEGLEVQIEHGFPAAQIAALGALGHATRPAHGLHFGGAQAIAIDPESGAYLGASDPRKDGLALGW